MTGRLRTRLRASSSATAPSLNLEFATAAGGLDPRVTFSRTTTATRVNASGLIESVAINGPRFDFDPVTLAPRGLLIEEQRTNLLTFSEQFDNAAWSKTSVTVSPNAATAPDGTTTADQITATAANSFIFQNFSSVAGVTYIASVWVRAVSADTTLDLKLFRDAGAAVMATTTFTATSTWQRVTLPATYTSTGTGGIYIGGGSSFSTGESIFIWGAQLEAGAFATSYIPTVASQVTRTADNASMLGANFSSWYNQSEGTFVATGSSFGGAVSGLYEASASGAAAQSISVRLGQRFSFAQNLNRFDFSYTTGNTINHAFAYSASNYGAAVGGTNLTVNANGQPTSVPAGANQLALGYLGSSAFMLNGHIRSIRYYPTRLTNAQLQAITA